MVDNRLSNKWVESSGKLKLSLELNNFSECIDLIDKIAGLAEKQNHHPNMHVTDYKKITIEVYTHSEDKITEKDYSLAHEIDKLL